MSDTPSIPPTNAQGEIKETRRGFYLTCIYGLQAIMGAMLAVPAFIYLFFPPKTRKEPEWIEAADLSRIPIGKPEEVVFQRNRVDGWKILSEKTTAWVVRKPDNQVIAFAPQCTHLGCAYHWDDATHNFVCPCHASFFTIDGVVLSGPAPRPLDRYAVRTSGNKLEIGPLERHA